MSFIFDERQSDSPLVETIWRTHSERAGAFTSVAVSRWEMVVTKQRGKISLAVRGPETGATTAPIPEDAEFFGITFKHGAFMPHLPTAGLVDGGQELPQATSGSFWLNGSAWQIPDFESADTFIKQLERDGVLVFDAVVGAASRGHPSKLSVRSVRRRFLRATGLTPGAIRQIERARQAAALLQQGVPILDTIHQTGFFDQPHLTRSLKRFIGHTPAEILHTSCEMSLSYKTSEFYRDMEGPR
jgi:hypothetical protein